MKRIPKTLFAYVGNGKNYDRDSNSGSFSPVALRVLHHDYSTYSHNYSDFLSISINNWLYGSIHLHSIELI